MRVDRQQVDFERIRVLYSAMKRILVGGVLLILALGLIINETLESSLVLLWVGVTILSYLPRVIFTSIFNKKIINKQITASNVLIWEQYWIITTVPVLAAFTALLFFPVADEVLVFIAVVLLILSSGSTMVYATSMKTIIASYSVIFIPLFIRFLMVGEPTYIILGFTFLACFIVFHSYALSLNRTLVENIELKIESENNSLKDPLTSLLNRRGMYLYLDKIIPHSIRNELPFGIILLDIDHFKKYNDTHGHTAGDDLLVKISSLIESEAREGDLVVRYGGEEFLLVVPETNMSRLKEYTDRIFNIISRECNVTFSAGLAIHAPDLSIDQLIILADDALYAAKHAGRSQYKIAKEQT